MFGTFTICLPSQHEGGELVLRHNGQTKVFDTSKYSDFDVSCSAWYADVLHEVRPVISGFRVMLTYNLIYTRPPVEAPRLALELDKDTQKLRTLVEAWDTGSGDSVPTKLVYNLEHQYTDASLSLASLKGDDQWKARALIQAVESTGLEVFLADVECTKNEDVEDDDGSGSELKLRRVVDMSGHQICQDIDIEEDDFVQDGVYDDRYPDSEDYQGYTGNEAAEATYWYRDTALLIIPRRCKISLFTENLSFYHSSVREMIHNYLQAWERNPDPGSKADLDDVCKVCVQRLKANVRRYGDTDAIMAIAECSLILNLVQAFQDTLGCFNDQIPSGTFQILGERLGNRFLEDNGWMASIDSALARFTTVAKKNEALGFLLEGLSRTASEDNMKVLNDYVSAKRVSMLKQVANVYPEDVETLFQLTLEHYTPALEDQLLRIAVTHRTNVPFAVKFVFEILKSTRTGSSFNRDKVFAACLQMLDSISAKLVLSELVTSRPVQRQSYGYLPYNAMPAETESSSTIKGSELAELVGEVLYTSHEKAVYMLDRVRSDTRSNGTLSQIKSLVLPMLQALIPLLQSRKLHFDSYEGAFQRLFQDCLMRFVEVSAGTEPPLTSSDWSRPSVSCDNYPSPCRDCQQLNRFLADPQQKIERFKMAENRRKHLSRLCGPQQLDMNTDRTNVPYTLVVTKNNKILRTAHDIWRQKVERVKTELNEFDQVALRELLADKADMITSLSIIRKHQSSAQAPGNKAGPSWAPPPLAQQSLAQQNVVSNPRQLQPTQNAIPSSSNVVEPPQKKRKRDEVIVVDLSED